jgi:ring-1,2-phenylacetyl-CoA epoxidase subunit PaaE
MSAPHEFHALRIAEIARPVPDAIVVSFDVPEALRSQFTHKAGQHIAVRTLIDGKEERRNYSVCVAEGRGLRIAVKRVAGGLVSNLANDQWQVGSLVEVMPPQGRFVIPPGDGNRRHVLMLAAGSGITPTMAMIEQALSAERQSAVTLVYGNRSLDSILFREELEDMKDRYLGRFDLIHILSRNDEIEAPLLQGRVNGEKLKLLAERRIDVTAMQHIFLCGPGSMIKETRDALFALGVARDRVHHEFFAPGGGAYRKAAAPVVVSRSASQEGRVPVVAVLDGIRHRFDAVPGEPLIDAALRAGVKAPYACKGGMCSTCRARIVEGTAAMAVNYSLEPWEIEKGFVLTCQAIVGAGAPIVIDYDAM